MIYMKKVNTECFEISSSGFSHRIKAKLCWNIIVVKWKCLCSQIFSTSFTNFWLSLMESGGCIGNSNNAPSLPGIFL